MIIPQPWTMCEVATVTLRRRRVDAPGDTDRRRALAAPARAETSRGVNDPTRDVTN